MSEATKSNVDYTIDTGKYQSDASHGAVTSFERKQVSQTQLRQEQKVIDGRDEEKKEKTARETIIPANMEALFEKTRHVRVANLMANQALRNNLKLHSEVQKTLLSLIDAGLLDQKARLVIATTSSEILGAQALKLHLTLRDDNSDSVNDALTRNKQDREIRRQWIDSWSDRSQEAGLRHEQLKRYEYFERLILNGDRTDEHRWLIAGNTTNETLQEEILLNFRKDPDAATVLIMNNRFLTEKTRAKANEIAALLKGVSFRTLMRGSRKR